MDKFRRFSDSFSQISSYERQIIKQVIYLPAYYFSTFSKTNSKSVRHKKHSITKGSSTTLLKAFTDKHPALHGTPIVQSFESLGLRQDLCNGLKSLNIHAPTPIQVDTIQKVLKGHNVLCASQTGSGKTLAYLLPILHWLKNYEETGGLMPRRRQPRVCIVVPFRELAVQILGVVKSLSHFTKLRSLGVISGRKKKWICEGLENSVDIVVSTPQTLLKYEEQGDIYLSDLSHIVMDEADTMFDGSFISLAVEILKHAGVTTNNPREHLPPFQATFATTTVSQDMLKIVDSILPNMQVCTADLHQVLPHVSQKFLKISQHEKSELLLNTISKELKTLLNGQIMVFCNTTKSCNWTSYLLGENHIPHSRLNGDMTKKERRSHLQLFREKEVPVLVCTDMASRGLDTTDVSHVINFDFPPTVVDYVHRAGRTGRLGYNVTDVRPQVTSFVSHNREIGMMEQIKKSMQANIPVQDANLWTRTHNKRKTHRIRTV